MPASDASAMSTSQNANPKNSGAFYMQAVVSFGVALFAVLVAVYYLPADPWIKAFFALSICYLVTSSFTLAKVIRDRQTAQETQQTTITGFEACELIDAQLRERQAICTVRFVTEQINVTRNAEGMIVDGNASEVTKVTDVWTFGRDTGSSDPNWLLVATSSD